MPECSVIDLAIWVYSYIDDTNIFLLIPNLGRLIVTCHDVADPKAQGSGKCEVTLLLIDSVDYWMNVDPDDYYEEKFKLGEQMVSMTEVAFPGIREHIEEMEISTAITNARFLGSPGGSIGGFKTFSREYFLAPMENNSQVPGLAFVGQWNNNTGGFYPTLMNGWGVGNKIADQLK